MISGIPVRRWTTIFALVAFALGAAPEPRVPINLPDSTQLLPLAKITTAQQQSAAEILFEHANPRFYEWSERTGAAVDRVTVLATMASEINASSQLGRQMDDVGLAAGSGDQIYCVRQKDVGWRAISFTRWEGDAPRMAQALGTDFSRVTSFAIVGGDLNAGIWVSGPTVDMIEPRFRLRVGEIVKEKLPESVTVHFSRGGKIAIYPPDVRVDLKLLLLDPRSRSIAVYTTGDKDAAAAPPALPVARLPDFGLGGPVEMEKPLAVEILLLTTAPQPIRGSLIRYDDEGFTLKAARGQRVLRWTDLSPGSAVAVRSQLMDRKKASDWFALGEFAWALGLKEFSRNALMTAVRMDPALQPRMQQVQDRELGWAIQFAAEPKFIKSTPAEDAAAIAEAREVAYQVSVRLKTRFREIQTPHFLIFTDWDARESEFLKANLEHAYAAVSKQFELPASQNIFIGKLPVYMFNRQYDFQKYAATIDRFPVSPNVAGYYMGRDDGSGHMAMWKPDVSRYGNDLHEAEIQWAYVLTHEFTHAFVARYRSNAHVPTWLNEGIAEVIAGNAFPSARPGVLRKARELADGDEAIDVVFTEGVKDGPWYPVMRTLVETLVRTDRDAFLQMFSDIKDGRDAQDAMIKNFGWDYAALQTVWRQRLHADR